MIRSTKDSLSRRRLARRLLGNSKGSAAIEFAILAPLFFAVLFSGFEAGMMYLKIGMVDHGISEVSRQIYTGGARNLTKAEIEDIFCDAVDTVLKCDGNVTLEVRRLSSYSNFNPGARSCIETGETASNSNTPNYSNTYGGDIVYIRVCITTNVMVPALRNLTFSMVNAGLQIPRSSSGRYELSAATVIRNEPF